MEHHSFWMAKSTTGWWLGHPSERYESQLGWWNSQYFWENRNCSKWPCAIAMSVLPEGLWRGFTFPTDLIVHTHSSDGTCFFLASKSSKPMDVTKSGKVFFLMTRSWVFLYYIPADICMYICIQIVNRTMYNYGQDGCAPRGSAFWLRRESVLWDSGCRPSPQMDEEICVQNTKP